MLLIYLAIVVVLVSFFVHRFMQSQSQADNEDAKVLADKEEKKENKDNKKGKKKRGGMGRRGGNDVQEARPAANETLGEEDDEEGPILSKKEQRKKDAKDDKADAKKDREEAEDNKRDKQSMRDKKYADRDAEREAMEEALAKEEAREVQRQKEAQEELDKWKDMFSVGEAGTEIDAEANEAQGRLAEFIEHIECKKVVAMEDLAAYFEMRPQDVLKRVEDLLMMERISGVIDDRGK